MSKLHKNIYITMLVTQEVVIGLIKNMVPYPFAFTSGAEPGLANLIIIIAIFAVRGRNSFFLVCLRLILTMLLGGTLSTFFYNASDALLSYFGMLLVKQLGPRRVSIIGISAADGFLHSIGQLLTTSFFAYSQAPMLYLPFLSLFGLLSGTTIKIAANYLLQHIQTLRKFQPNYEQATKYRQSQFF